MCKGRRSNGSRVDVVHLQLQILVGVIMSLFTPGKKNNRPEDNSRKRLSKLKKGVSCSYLSQCR